MHHMIEIDLFLLLDHPPVILGVFFSMDNEHLSLLRLIRAGASGGGSRDDLDLLFVLFLKLLSLNLLETRDS